MSANTIDKHSAWIQDIDEIAGSKLSFPIIGDKQRKIALLYDMYVDLVVSEAAVWY